MACWLAAFLFLSSFAASSANEANSSCAAFCECADSSAICSQESPILWSAMVMDSGVASLHINASTVMFDWPCVTWPDVKELRMTDCNISQWFNISSSLPMLQSLHFSNVFFTDISNISFSQLSHLQAVHLTNSNIEYLLHEETFHDLNQLRVVNLSNNALGQFPASNAPSHVHVLDLSKNDITYLDPLLSNITNLELLDVGKNSLKWISPNFIESIQTSDLRMNVIENPWSCSCGVTPLISLLAQQPDLFVNANDLECHSPPNLAGIHLSLVDTEEIVCEPPSFDVLPDNSTVIHHMYDAVFHCNATGSPKPNIYWVTPRGVVAHPSQKHWMTTHHIESTHSLSFAGPPSFFEAEVEAAENGDLLFRKFRFYFAGEYTCIAESPGGIETFSMNVTITKGSFSRIVVVSIAYGFIISMSVFGLGIIVGALRWTAERFWCKPDPELSTVYIDDDWMDVPTPGTEPFHPWHMPWMWSPSYSREDSPQKCVTPASPEEAQTPYDMDGDPGQSSHILEQLEDVRALLRHGMKRSMVKLRSGALQVREQSTRKMLNMRETSSQRLQTIRESSTRRLHNIRSSSSQYISHIRENSTRHMRVIRSSTGHCVNRVRTGVNIGMESVRSNILSIREFCGPGDIAHTVSTISVATDVDSNTQSQVVKQVTYL